MARCVCILLGMAMLDTAAAQNSAVVDHNAYFEMAPHYDSVSFDVGPRLTFESPNAERYRDLTIAAHDGRPRLGLLDDYGARAPTQDFEERNAKQVVTKRLGDEHEIFLGLLALRFAQPHFTSENLLGRNPYNPLGYIESGGVAPVGYAGALAINLFQDSVYGDHFCGGRDGCAESRYRSLLSFNASSVSAGARRWGGANDEFAARTAVESFIDEDLEALIGWSESLPLDAAFAGSIVMPEYDFGKGGYVLAITLPTDASPSSSSIGYLYHERADAAVKVMSQDENSAYAFLPLDAGEAEQLTEAINRPGVLPLLYFTVDGVFYNVMSEEDSVRSRTGYRPLYELTSPTITFYSDSALTQVVGEATLTPEMP